MFGVSIVVNRALRPLKDAIGEGVGDVIADVVDASGKDRERIVNTTKKVVRIGGSLGVSCLMADAIGAADVIDGMTS
jgi:hypothetical protein